MSDLAATGCGGSCGSSCFGGNNSCLLLLILLAAVEAEIMMAADAETDVTA